MLRIVICEDNEHYLNQLVTTINALLLKNKIKGSIVYYTTNSSDLESLISTIDANTFFLDIDLKNATNGYMLAEKIRKNNIHAYIVFITGHFEYVLQAFKVHSFDFLTKPLADEVLEQCLIRIDENYNLLLNNCKLLEVKCNSSIYKIKPENIVYIERMGRNTIICLKHGQITCHESLESLEKLLNSDIFIRCHKSFIANKSYIMQVHLKDKIIVFETGHQCCLGRKYKNNII